MKKTSSQSRVYMAPVGVAAVLGMAGMGLVSSGVVAADTTSVTDTINVTVQPSCTFNSVEDKTYTGSASNGAEVGNFNDSGVHEFNLFCNDNNGFIVTATPYDLESSGIEDVIAYTDNYTPSGVNSIWSAAIASDATGVTVVPVVPVGGGTILSSDTSTATAGVDFSATYSAYVGTATPAGTYTGTIVYTLTASGTSNDSNSGNSGNSGGGNSGTEVTDNTDNGDSGAGGSGANNSGSGTEEPSGSNSAPSNTQNAAPMMTSLNNSYSTNNTYNTYNTTNYNGGNTSTSMPAATSMQGTTSGNSTTSGNDTASGSDSEASDSYEKPLGVTTSTSSSNEDSGVDVMPVVATGIALAVTGAAAIALSQSKKKEEERRR